MAGKGIPRGDGVGFEIFDKANFGISDFVQRANYTRAVQGELARTISQLDQVENARVMIVMPENRLLMDNPAQADRLGLRPGEGSAQLPASAVNSIRFLVANSVEGLQANNVSVVDNMGNVLSENEDNDSVAGLSNNQLTARRNFEQYLSKKAEGMLEKVLGPGQAVVRVSAEINWDTTTRTEEKFDPDGQVARTHHRSMTRTRTRPRQSGGGAARDVAANATSDTNAASGAARQHQPHAKEVDEQPIRNQQDHQQPDPGGRRDQAPLHRGLHRPAFRRQGSRPQGGAAHAGGSGEAEATSCRARWASRRTATPTRKDEIDAGGNAVQRPAGARNDPATGPAGEAAILAGSGAEVHLSGAGPGRDFPLLAMLKTTAKDEIPLGFPMSQRQRPRQGTARMATGVRHGRGAQPIDPGEPGQHDPGRAQLAGAGQN